MPPRWAVIGIILFWLGATAWLVQREMWPVWFPPPHQPPNYDVDMIDEFGSTASWHVYLHGINAGMGSSEVRMVRKDGTLKFASKLLFQRKPLLFFCVSIETVSHITNQGQLLDFSVLAKLKMDPKLEVLDPIQLEGKVEGGYLRARGSAWGRTLDLEPIKVPENGIVFNPAAMGTRIRNLWKGQTWRVPTMDIGDFVKQDPNLKAFDGFVQQLRASVRRELYATVDEEVIRWPEVGGQDVACFRIDMSEPGKDRVEASIWVRKRDGQVLKQQVESLGLLMERVEQTGN